MIVIVFGILFYLLGCVLTYFCLFLFEYYHYTYILDKHKRIERALKEMNNPAYYGFFLFSWLSLLVFLLLAVIYAIEETISLIRNKVISLAIKEKDNGKLNEQTTNSEENNVIEPINRKYVLTNEIKRWYGRTLYRIQAVRDFGNVKKGQLGGWVEKEDNLSHSGLCWIDDETKVFDEARVFCNAQVFDNALVYDSSLIFDNAQVHGETRVFGGVEIYGNARVFGDATIRGYIAICGDAIIKQDSDYLVFKNNWSSGRYFTYTKSNKMWSVGCFRGTGQQLIEKAYQDSELSGQMYEKYVRFVESLEEVGS